MGNLKKVLVWPDTHVPYEDKAATQVALKALSTLQPTHVVILGDFVDFYQLSFHEKSPGRKVSLAGELSAGKRLLGKIATAAGPQAKLVFLSGNHEHRLQRYLANKAPELQELPSLALSNLLGLNQYGYSHYAYREVYKLGKAHFTHDIGRCGKYVAPQSLADFGHNIVVGHAHRGQVFYGGTVRGESHVGMCAGWLGSVKSIDYRSQALANREWTHSFGVVYIEPKGNCHMQLVPIVDRKCVIEGKLVRA